MRNDRPETSAVRAAGRGVAKLSAILATTYLLIHVLGRVLGPAPYRELPLLGGRLVVWVVAQFHLMFAAFVLGVPVFVLVTEIVGVLKGSARHDRLAREFTRLLAASYTLTALVGAALLVSLFVLYPRVVAHMRAVFEPTWFVYLGLIFLEILFAYLYWHTWDALARRKGWHVFLGVVLNLLGVGVLAVTSSWVGYMMTPAGVEGRGLGITVVSRWRAVFNRTWFPLTLHRFIANVCFGGAVAAAYGAFRFLGARDDEERARFDWMGYVGSFIAVAAFLPLPFAGYYFGTEIYAYSQQMGVAMMGGSFAQLWYLQAILIGSLLLGFNLYLWLGMGRIPGAERYRKFQLAILVVLASGFAVWATPHTILASASEFRAMGGVHHPKLGVLGVMSAKNTAVNMMILASFLNFMFYRRANRLPKAPWAGAGKLVQALVLAVSSGIVVGYGVYGYFVPAAIQVRFSAYQVLAVLGFLVVFLGIEVPMYRGAQALGEIRWGKVPRRSQYVLLFLAISFTWLMGLMGYIRAGIREFWHVYGVMRDASGEAYIPAHGYATAVVSAVVLVFFLGIALVFALAIRSERREEARA